MTTKNRAVIGILGAYSEAEDTITDLESKGFVDSDISVLFPNKGTTRDFAHEHGTKAPEGAVVGGGTGGLAGGAIGLLAGIGAIAMPGLGPLIAAGPIVALLTGAAVGAAVGSIAGALVGMGIPEIQAKAYEARIHGGNFLIAIHTEDRRQVDLAKLVLAQHGAEDISVTSEATVPAHEKASPRA
jgi:hypothetical protein